MQLKRSFLQICCKKNPRGSAGIGEGKDALHIRRCSILRFVQHSLPFLQFLLVLRSKNRKKWNRSTFFASGRNKDFTATTGYFASSLNFPKTFTIAKVSSLQ